MKKQSRRRPLPRKRLCTCRRTCNSNSSITLGPSLNDPDGRLFPSSRKGVPVRPGNFLHRVLKPAALLAGVSVRASAKGKPTSGLIPIAAENILDPVRRESERPEIHPGPHAPR